ncbi:RelA/SpoT family protein [Nocardia fluminea]|uniref:RelA/SpoT family protein n=1 Tax=Nocardia fluminea TaxID=134984 RepID=A0A2N3V4A3_9NOCA|nr:RelA/SpoT family protein [Nocardia fluminea]
MGIIDEFIDRFDREYYLYENAAKIAHRQLDEQLNEAGVRCIVSHRVKNAERLRNKCIQRNESNPYDSVDSIFADIVDLAGARVALYFPAERDRVDRAITRKFEILEPRKEFPQNSPHPLNRFFGYSAVHYRVNLRESELDEADKRCAQVRVEIQVASVLMHAWSEVEHDLAYKPMQGDLSSEEKALLDQLNGLVHAGEIALEQLQLAGLRRTHEVEKPFRTHYDLAAHIIGYIEKTQGPNAASPEVGAVDVLHGVLQKLGLATPQACSPYLARLNAGLEKRTLVDQIIDALLDEDISRVRPLTSVREAIGGISGDAPMTSVSEMYIEFIQGWNELDHMLRSRLPVGTKITSTPMTTEVAFDCGIIDREAYHSIHYLRMRRNGYVHSKRKPDTSALEADLHALNRLKKIVGTPPIE